jgi:hypothetical protein
MAPLLLVDILSVLSSHPQLLQGVQFGDIVKFYDLVCLMKPVIELAQSVHTPGLVTSLPLHVHNFLRACLGLDDDILKLSAIVFYFR